MPWYSHDDHRPGMVVYICNTRIEENNVSELSKFKVNLDDRVRLYK